MTQQEDRNETTANVDSGNGKAAEAKLGSSGQEDARPTKEQRADRFDLRTIYETSGILSGSLDIDFIANNLLLTAMSKLLAMRGAVWMKADGADNTFALRAQKGCRGLPKDVTSQSGLALDKILVDDEIPEEFGSGFLKLLAPIVFDSTLLGVLGLGGSVRPTGFTSREIEFVSSLVNMTSAAFQNSLTVDQLRNANRELDTKIQQLNTLFDLSQEFNATVDRDKLVRLLTLSLMGQMLVSKHIFLLRRSNDSGGADDDGERIDVVSAKGANPDGVSAGMRALLLMLDAQLSVVHGSPDEQVGDCAKIADWMKAEGFEYVLPIKRHDATAGVLCLGPKLTRQPYSDGDIEFVSALGNLASVSITNSMLVEQQIEKERLEQEMKLAREIQENLQPSSVPQIEGLDIAFIALPSQMVAGDYLDIIELDDKRTLFAVGDVTGKGLPASLLMSNVQACLHILLPMDMSIEEATVHINRVICGNTTFDKFITFFYGIYSVETRAFNYVNAGHNPPMVVHADGTSEELEAGGLLLGVMAGVPYDSGTLNVKAGDVIAIFTDGVTEAMSIDEEEYGEERLLEVLKACRDQSADGIMETVLADIKVFTKGVDILSDDLTMIIIKAGE